MTRHIFNHLLAADLKRRGEAFQSDAEGPLSPAWQAPVSLLRAVSDLSSAVTDCFSNRTAAIFTCHV